MNNDEKAGGGPAYPQGVAYSSVVSTFYWSPKLIKLAKDIIEDLRIPLRNFIFFSCK